MITSCYMTHHLVSKIWYINLETLALLFIYNVEVGKLQKHSLSLGKMQDLLVYFLK